MTWLHNQKEAVAATRSAPPTKALIEQMKNSSAGVVKRSHLVSGLNALCGWRIK